LPVSLDLDRIEQVRRGAAGAKAAQLLLEHAKRTLHAPFKFANIVIRRCHEPLPTTACERASVSPILAPIRGRAPLIHPRRSRGPCRSGPLRSRPGLGLKTR